MTARQVEMSLSESDQVFMVLASLFGGNKRTILLSLWTPSIESSITN